MLDPDDKTHEGAESAKSHSASSGHAICGSYALALSNSYISQGSQPKATPGRHIASHGCKAEISGEDVDLCSVT